MKFKSPWRITMNKKAMTLPTPQGPGFSEDEAQAADSMSIALFDSSNSEDQDYIKYTLYTKEGKIIKEKIINVP